MPPPAGPAPPAAAPERGCRRGPPTPPSGCGSPRPAAARAPASAPSSRWPRDWWTRRGEPVAAAVVVAESEWAAAARAQPREERPAQQPPWLAKQPPWAAVTVVALGRWAPRAAKMEWPERCTCRLWRRRLAAHRAPRPALRARERASEPQHTRGGAHGATGNLGARTQPRRLGFDVVEVRLLVSRAADVAQVLAGDRLGVVHRHRGVPPRRFPARSHHSARARAPTTPPDGRLLPVERIWQRKTSYLLRVGSKGEAWEMRGPRPSQTTDTV